MYSWARHVATSETWPMSHKLQAVKTVKWNCQRYKLVGGCFLEFLQPHFQDGPGRSKHWSLLIRLTAQWNGSSATNEGAVKIRFTQQRLNSDLQPESRGLKIDSQQVFVLLHEKMNILPCLQWFSFCIFYHNGSNKDIFRMTNAFLTIRNSPQIACSYERRREASEI